MSEGKPGVPNRTIRDTQADPERALNRRDALVSDERARTDERVVGPAFPRRPLPAGDPASEGGASVTFDELDLELQQRIESQEGNYAAPVQTIQNLRDVAPADRADKQIRLVEDAASLYRFDTADTTTPDDGDLVVAPTDPLPPNGRWFKLPPSPAPATSVVSETSFGQAPAVGTTARFSREDHTHGTPALGTGALEACAGNDARLSDARVPTAHAASHLDYGAADEIRYLSAWSWVFDSTSLNVDEDPGDGKFRANHATWSLATAFSFSGKDVNGNLRVDLSQLLAALQVGDRFFANSQVGVKDFGWNVAGPVVTPGSYTKIPTTGIHGSSGPPNGTRLYYRFLMTSRTPESHAASHQNGGADEIGVAGLSGVLADAQNPTSHATSHQHGGTDEVAVAVAAANAIPKAAADAMLAAPWHRPFVGGIPAPATVGVKGAVPAPTAAQGSDVSNPTILGNGAWGQPHGARVAAGQMWRWNTQILDVDPGNGQYSYNNALQASATVLYVNDRALFGLQSGLLARLVPKDRIYIAQTNQDLQRFQIWEVTGVPIVAVGYTKIPVALVDIGASSIAANTLTEWGFSFVGPHPVVAYQFFTARGTSFLGDYAVRSVASNAQGRVSFHAPSNLGALVSVELVGIVSAGAAQAARDIDFYTSYAALGEPSTQHQQSDLTSVYDLSAVSGQIYSFDLTALFTALAAGDYAGVQVDHNSIGGAIDYLGIRLGYAIA